VLHGGADGNTSGVANVIKVGVQVSQKDYQEVGEPGSTQV